jgi:signal transduction histidine kinase
MDLLSDVLDLSRLEANVLPVALEPVDLGEVVDEAFGLLSAQAGRRECRLVHDHCDDLRGDHRVLGDRRRLRQVLINLVANSVRHGRPGGRVAVSCRPTPDGSSVLVTIDDDGPGIPPDLLPRIFTPYARAAPDDDAAEPSTESIGLGLALAHGLVRAMDGDLSVGRSGPGGTSMHLRLPRPPGGPS